MEKEIPKQNASEVVDGECGPLTTALNACQTSTRCISLFVITSVICFALLRELHPNKQSAMGELEDVHGSATDSPTVIDRSMMATTVPPVSMMAPTSRTKSASVKKDSSTTEPTSKTESSTEEPKTPMPRIKERKNAPVIPTVFPLADEKELTTDAIVKAKHQSITKLLTCFGNNASDERVFRYEFVFAPIGCFGDPVKGECKSTSCNLALPLAAITQCGLDKFGSFLGDNFYPWGLRSARESRFESDLYAKFWRHPELRMKYYSTVGNHDKPKPWTQIRRDHPYFVMPSFHHASPELTGKDGKTTVQLFLFDSHWGFAGNDPHMKEESEWLDSALSNSTARWKIVASHEPIWGFADFEHNKGMIQYIHPVLLKHQVKLLVAAHAHSVQLHHALGGYLQLISAGFSDNIHSYVKPNRPAGYYHLGRGATAVLVNHDFLDIVAFDQNKNLIFSHRLLYPQDGKLRPNVVSLADSATVGEKNSTMIWKWRRQCEAMLPSIPPYCKH